MIDYGYVEICLNFLKVKDEKILNENLRLLGSLVSIQYGRKRLSPNMVKQIHSIIIEGSVKTREMFGFFLCRLCSGRDGVMIVIKNGFVPILIESFYKFSEEIERDNYMYIK